MKTIKNIDKYWKQHLKENRFFLEEKRRKIYIYIYGFFLSSFYIFFKTSFSFLLTNNIKNNHYVAGWARLSSTTGNRLDKLKKRRKLKLFIDANYAVKHQYIEYRIIFYPSLDTNLFSLNIFKTDIALRHFMATLQLFFWVNIFIITYNNPLQKVFQFMPFAAKNVKKIYLVYRLFITKNFFY